jgi:FabA-like domain
MRSICNRCRLNASSRSASLDDAAPKWSSSASAETAQSMSFPSTRVANPTVRFQPRYSGGNDGKVTCISDTPQLCMASVVEENFARRNYRTWWRNLDSRVRCTNIRTVAGRTRTNRAFAAPCLASNVVGTSRLRLPVVDTTILDKHSMQSLRSINKAQNRIKSKCCFSHRMFEFVSISGRSTATTLRPARARHNPPTIASITASIVPCREPRSGRLRKERTRRSACDRVLELEPQKNIKALKNVSINEPYFVGYFPTRPVMPGVLILMLYY